MRTIVRTHRFELDLQNLLQSNARAIDEFIEATEWALSRRAEIGTPVSRANGTQVWFLPVVNVPRIDQFVVYYTFDATHLLSIAISHENVNQ